MLSRTITVDQITAQMNRMVNELEKLARKREELSAQSVAKAEVLRIKADVDYAEAVKARGVAAKIAELVA